MGGAGFMGSNLAHKLVKMGGEVTVYDALLPGYGGNLFNLEGIRKEIVLFEKDIRDKEALTLDDKGSGLAQFDGIANLGTAFVLHGQFVDLALAFVFGKFRFPDWQFPAGLKR